MGPATFVEHARDAGVELTQQQMQAHRAAFLAAYTGVAAWQEQVKRSAATEARSHGGRRIVFDKGTTVPQRLNAPIQATGADGLKKAMVLLHERLRPLGAQLVLAVHDELLVEAPEARAEEARQLVHATAQNTHSAPAGSTTWWAPGDGRAADQRRRRRPQASTRQSQRSPR